MEVTPDRAGYVEAQERLRRLLGESIILLAPADRTYPTGTALDPETGEPYDPLIEATAVSQASAAIQGRVAFRGVPRNETDVIAGGALGFMEDADIAVIAGSGVASAASGAVAMVVRDERYEIRSSRFDGLAGVDRYLIFGAKDPNA